jgi:hypothetical protein
MLYGGLLLTLVIAGHVNKLGVWERRKLPTKRVSFLGAKQTNTVAVSKRTA